MSAFFWKYFISLDAKETFPATAGVYKSFKTLQNILVCLLTVFYVLCQKGAIGYN